MEWLPIGVGVGIWAVGSLGKHLVNAIERKRHERIDLQFWEADLAPGEAELGSDLQVHFPSMLMKATFWSTASGTASGCFMSVETGTVAGKGN